jgi:hypothetical protein
MQNSLFAHSMCDILSLYRMYIFIVGKSTAVAFANNVSCPSRRREYGKNDNSY